MPAVIDQLPLGPLQTNCYLVRAERGAAEAVVVDPSGTATDIRLALASHGARCAAILVTHGHFDHILGLADLAEGTGAPSFAPAAERALLEDPAAFTPPGLHVRAWTPTTLLEGGEALDLAGIRFDVVAVPGHSPGHLAFAVDGALLSGDVLFAGSVGRTDLPGRRLGDADRLHPEARRRIPGRHGRAPGPRAVDDARRRARGESVPRGAAGRAARVGAVSDRVKLERPRGTHDVVPAEMPRWDHVTGEIERLCGLYGFRRIVTPVFEDTALFQRTSGSGSDVVQKEMYTFSDRSDRSLTLRPEGTAPICRAYVEHGMHREPQPVKLFTIASMYRYGAPGRGRYREHWQASVETLGSDDPAVDAELIQLYDTLLARLGVTRYHLELNSIGCRECRPAYLDALRAWLEANGDRLDEETRAKIGVSPLRVFDNYLAKPPAVRTALDEAPKIGESLCAACVAHFAAVRADLDAMDVAYTIIPTLVRGLDYYTRTTFEFVGPTENQNSTITGGGRYDYLIEEIGGPPTPGIGFGAGIERLIIAMEEEGVPDEPRPATDVFIALDEGAPRAKVARWLADLRRAGVAAQTDYAGRSLKGQLTQARRLGAAQIVVVGREGATVRVAGETDEQLEHDEIVSRLSP